MIKNSKKWKTVLRALIGLACVFYVIYFFIQNLDRLHLIKNIDLLSILMIFILAIAAIVLYCLRFLIILEKCSLQRIPWGAWVRVTMIARFLNMIFSQFGNIYRAVYLKKQHQISYTNYIGTFTSFAWFDTCLNLASTTILIGVLNPGLHIGDFHAWRVILVFFVFILTLPFAGRYVLSLFTFNNRFLVWIHDKLSQVVQVTFVSMKDLRFVLKISALGLIVLLLNIVGYKILFNSFTIPVDLAAIAVFCSLLKISNFINITPGNIGVQEIIYGFLSEQMGIGMAEGMMISIAGRLVISLITILWGIAAGGMEVLRTKNIYCTEEIDDDRNKMEPP